MGAASCSQRCAQPTKELVIGCDSCGTAPQSSTIPTGQHPPPEETGCNGGAFGVGMVEESELEEVPGESGWPDAVMPAPEVTGAEDLPRTQVLHEKRLVFRCDADTKQFARHVRHSMFAPDPVLTTVIEEADKRFIRPSVNFEVDDNAPVDRNPLRKPTPFARMVQRPDEDDDEASTDIPETEHQERKPRLPPQKPVQPKLQQASPVQPQRRSGVGFFTRRASGRKVNECASNVPPPEEDAIEPD